MNSRTHTTAPAVWPMAALWLALLWLSPFCLHAQSAVDPFLAADQRFAQKVALNVAPGGTAAENTGDQLGYWLNDPEIRPSQYVDEVYGAPACVECSPYDSPSGAWRWELMPDGLIYRSYQAGPRESRLALHTFHKKSSLQNSEWIWDATLGGRRGIMRFGNGDPSNPEGWQLDIEGAAVVRLNLDEQRDVDASDFRFGVPLTYGQGPVQYKMGYYHVSSHLGDEFIVRNGNSRINYVRDALIAGVSYNPTPCWRVYGETAYAFFTAGGAEPWEFQFGAEYSRPGPTGFYGTPFVATNAHLREELDFSGDWTLQAGWLWRGATESTFRLGLHYMNGKSTQYQFFGQNEEQIGLGIWYDF